MVEIRNKDNLIIHSDAELTDLVGINLSERNLPTASFGDCDLRRANLDGANLFKADFRFADLRGASLDGGHFDGACLKGARLDDEQRAALVTLLGIRG